MTGSLNLLKVSLKGGSKVKSSLGLGTAPIVVDGDSFEEAKSGNWQQDLEIRKPSMQSPVYEKIAVAVTAFALIASWQGVAPSSNITFDNPLVIDSRKETSTMLHTIEPLGRKRVSRREAAQLAIDILLKAEERRIRLAEEANNSSFGENENDL